MKPPLVRIFVSYAHKDDYWMQRLMPLLKFPGVLIKPWSDKKIPAGVRWHDEIQRELEQMDVFVALVSPHFCVSSYIQKDECPVAKRRLKDKEIEVVPVYLAPPGGTECKWLMDLQRVPPDKSWAESFREFREFDLSLAPIRDGIGAAVKRARARLCKRGP